MFVLFTSQCRMAALLLASWIAGTNSFSTTSIWGRHRHSSSSSLASSSSSYATADDHHHHHHHHDARRHLEFMIEPVVENDIRRQRLEKDLENRNKFVHFGDALWKLRSEMELLSARLMATPKQKKDVATALAAKLQQAQQQDPELQYTRSLAAHQAAVAANQADQAAVHWEQAQMARSCLPQYNLNGLWVGKYGSHGYELINVTYVGDTLIGIKVTGDQNVPRGEITFTVDLNPLRHNNNNNEATTSGDRAHYTSTSDSSSRLQPIQLTDQAAQKWGTSQLPRYAGLGQVAEAGFRNRQWMDGQIIIIGQDYFSFAWLPIEQQIFFGRPSPELALKMLRDSGVAPLRTTSRVFDQPPSLQDDVAVQKDFILRCLEKTHEIEDEMMLGHEEASSSSLLMGCIWHTADECYFE